MREGLEVMQFRGCVEVRVGGGGSAWRCGDIGNGMGRVREGVGYIELL